MRRFSTVLAIALSLLFLVSINSAQQTSTTAVPNLIRYSGTLKDAQGAALSSAPLGVTFAIYKQQDSGAAVWLETQNVTPDANGQYSVVLGSTTAKGIPNDLFSQQEERWLGVQVQGQAEQARVLLVSVPYAFKAYEAETLGGLPASAFVKAATSDASTATSTDASSSEKTGTTANAAGTAASGKTKLRLQAPIDATIPVFDASQTGNYGLNNSLMSQDRISNATQVKVNGNFNLQNGTNAYQIGGNSVLSTSGESLSVGPGAGGGIHSTFVGYSSGTNNRQGQHNTFVGDQAGVYNQSGSYNTFSGEIAGQNTDTSYNSFYGYAAGANNYFGDLNTSFGYKAGYGQGQSKGNENAFFGANAGLNITSGNQNTFSGTNAGWSNTTGGTNSFFGYGAGFSNTTASYNTYFGYKAGYKTTNAGGNTFVGYLAGFSNTGSSNTLVGSNAGLNNIGSFNTFFGTNAGNASTTGSQNTFTGFGAGGFNTTGSNNTYYGYKAGPGPKAPPGASLNIYFGFLAGQNTGGGSNNIEIGNQGLGTDDNTIRIGNVQTSTYIAGITNSLSGNLANVYVDSSGRLYQGFPGGGGNVSGPGNCGDNYLTKWIGGSNVDCSKITELDSGTNYVGIGPHETAPTSQLQVYGDIDIAPAYQQTRQSGTYKLAGTTVLSTGSLGGNFFAGLDSCSGLIDGHNTCVGNFAGYHDSNVTPHGIFNILIGDRAGSKLFQSSDPGCKTNDNILIGNDGAACESRAIRIGHPEDPQDLDRVYIAGITKVTLNDKHVCVVTSGSNTGQLGVCSSANQPTGDLQTELQKQHSVVAAQ